MSAMKRRSLAPVRPSELFEYRVAESAAEKKPIVPRQLNFTGNASRRSMFGRSKNFSSTGNATQRTRTSLSGRVSLSGKARQDVSVLDGVSLLGLTINESSDDVTIQNPKPGAASTSSKPVCSVNASQVVKKSDEAMTANGLKMCNTSVSSVSNKTFSSCYQSSSDLCETKIPKPKIHTTESTRKTSVEMNSTAAFEEEEIAALTSTPHPDRRSKSIVPLLSSTSENSELAEQMKLFIMDQRSLMQAVKLSCQKSTAAMEQMDSLMVQMNTFMGQMITLVEKLTLKVDPHAELNKLVAKSESCQNNDEIAVSDDKENVDFRAGNARRSISMFADMKSQLKCLKTPTTVKNRTLCETPNTLLSNTVHCQLESLYEGSETDT